MSVTIRRRVGAISLALLLGACAGQVVPPPVQTASPRAGRLARPVVHPSAVTPEPSVRTLTPGRIVAATPLLPAPVAPVTGAATAAAAGVVPGPAVASLSIDARQATAALAAFRRSCPGLMRRADTTGLTRGPDWQPGCAAAATAGGDPAGFFARYFETAQVGDGKAFATGYYEPEIAGSLDERPGYVPIYARPADLVDVDLGQFADDLKGRTVRGKVFGTKFVPFDDRTQIEEGSLATRAPVLAWAADPVEFFFLQIQGSGRVRLPDGRILRIGYDTQNGRGYTGIGKLMRERGLLGPGQTSMQGIVAWLRANPEQGRGIMRENKSFVFFRELTGAPIGAMGYAVDGQVSAAVDVKFVPLGAPVYLSMDRADATGLWVAQDTGGAIKGSNRFDTFWGAGQAAATVAGGMAARGTAFLLLPIGTVARLQGSGQGYAQPYGQGTVPDAPPAQP
jgi:membrane-bound lytic murein transglycosylase A